jgi:hypothetical protein
MIIPEAGTPQSQHEQTLRLHIGTAQGRRCEGRVD